MRMKRSMISCARGSKSPSSSVGPVTNTVPWSKSLPVGPNSSRGGVEDNWHRNDRKGVPCTDPKHGKLGTQVESASHGNGKRWRARYVDPSGREVQRSFHAKPEAEAWKTAQTADIAKGS
jgi:hypothetical protein